MAQPHLDLAKGESSALGGLMSGVPINRALRGTPPPPAGPSSCPGTHFLGPEIMPWVLCTWARPKPPLNPSLLRVPCSPSSRRTG